MSSNQPLVSVLMPCYNAAAYFDEAVQSVLNQSYKNLEILLIDDGSSDNTRSLIADYASRDSRIVPVYNEHNLGLIRTLNKGVKMASGEYVARMDADDISSDNRIERMIEVLNENPAVDVISAGYYSMSADGKRSVRVFPKANNTLPLLFVSFFCTPVNHPCMMARSVVMKANPFDEQYIHSEDYEIFSRLLLLGSGFRNLDEPLYYLRRNPHSVSNKFERIQIANHTRISIRNIEQYFGKSFDYFIHKIMINRISFNCSADMLKEAFLNLQLLRDEFEKRENPGSGEKQEITDFLTEQYIDIFLQSLKYASWKNRIGISVLMMKYLDVLLSTRALQYFRSKWR